MKTIEIKENSIDSRFKPAESSKWCEEFKEYMNNSIIVHKANKMDIQKDLKN